MGYLKENFKNVLKEHGHHIIYYHTNNKQSCPRHQHKKEHEHPSQCYHCFGNNLLYKATKLLTRRSDANSMFGERKKLDDPISFSGNTYNYFYLPDTVMNDNDFIIEYKNNDLELFQVINTDKHYGDGGDVAFRSSLVAQKFINEEVLKKSLYEIFK